jgi:hypothetical protein
MFDDFVEEDVPRVREPRPLLLNLPLVEQLVIETKPVRLQAIRAAFASEVRQCHACVTGMQALVLPYRFLQHAGIAASDPRALWIGVCKEYLDTACWIATGDFSSVLLSSAAGRAVLGALSEDQASLATLQSFDLLTQYLRRRASRFILHGDGDVDAFVNPDSTSDHCWNTPTTLRAASVLHVAVALLNLFTQVRPALLLELYGWLEDLHCAKLHGSSIMLAHAFMRAFLNVYV